MLALTITIDVYNSTFRISTFRAFDVSNLDVLYQHLPKCLSDSPVFGVTFLTFYFKEFFRFWALWKTSNSSIFFISIKTKQKNNKKQVLQKSRNMFEKVSFRKPDVGKTTTASLEILFEIDLMMKSNARCGML